MPIQENRYYWVHWAMKQLEDYPWLIVYVRATYVKGKKVMVALANDDEGEAYSLFDFKDWIGPIEPPDTVTGGIYG